MTRMIFLGGPANGRVLDVPEGNRGWVIASFSDDDALLGHRFDYPQCTTYSVQKFAVEIERVVYARECMVTGDVTPERATAEIKAALFAAWMKREALT